jgi:hypothetical protein
MYMPTVVNSGSSDMILYPRESYDSWANPEGSIRIVCQSTTWYLDRILCPRESYDSWEDREGSKGRSVRVPQMLLLTHLPHFVPIC